MASWGKFSSQYHPTHLPSEIPALSEAWSYFVANPPRKQLLKDGVLDWSDPWHRKGEPELTWLCDVLKVVRNNLFHGGKFLLPTGPIGEPARNKHLLQHGLKVFAILIDFDPDVRTNYFDTAS
jgi:hypothetical protein